MPDPQKPRWRLLLGGLHASGHWGSTTTDLYGGGGVDHAPHDPYFPWNVNWSDPISPEVRLLKNEDPPNA